ncbi:LysR family transcriptional regulator [Nonomuraea sp. NPDC050310]|uniref:LysR family transcriptional regulator n=1 Tax=Nonomuraea sp. NPDC050310 TaxID=3154935 RepID=UPI0033D0E419
MEIRQLRYFVTVADEGGFARAAEHLQIVQPAVSQQIARLERELGVRLFDRSARRIRLTGAGERLLPEARALLASEDRIRLVAADIATGHDGVLRLGSSQGLGERLDRVLQKLEPRVQVRLSALPHDERLAAVRTGELDAAFVRAVHTAPGLELLPIWTDALVVALPAAHRLAGSAVIDLVDLAELPLRLAPRAHNRPLYDLVMAACRDAGFEPVAGPAFTNLQDTMAEIGAGPPSWTVLYQAAAELVPVRRVALRPLAGVTVPTSLAVPPGPPGPALRLLLDAVRR